MRDLDRQIAERVMRWTAVHHWSEPPSDYGWVGKPPGYYSESKTQLPYFSGDFSAALRVVEQMEKLGYVYFTLKKHQYADDSILWDARFSKMPHTMMYGKLQDVPCVAICEAALKAIGRKKNE